MIIPDNLLEFLKKNQADETAHLRGSLFRHLIGTYRLLKLWGNEEDVCNAGLFHSVYGTTAFKHQIIAFDRRDEVVKVIGAEAEWLAYLFCVTNRPQAFFAAAASHGQHLVLHDYRLGEYVHVLPRTMDRLLEIEAANLLEQGAPRYLYQRLLDSGVSQKAGLELRRRIAAKMPVPESA